MRQFINKLALTTATLVAGAMMVLGGHAAAIPYQGASTPPLPHPGFNVFTGTPSVGDEPDFLRGKVDGTSGYVDPVNSACADGTKIDLRVYVHNGASDQLNNGGNGPSVAHNTHVNVLLPANTTAPSFPLTSTISSPDASPTSVTDGLTINCNGKTVVLSYVKHSAQQYSIAGGTQPLSDNIVTPGGALIGTVHPDGNMWACWDQRVWVTLQLEVKTPPTPPPVVSTGDCKLVDVKATEDRKVTVKVNGQTNNAQIVDYQIDFGDGTKVNQQSAEHTYAKDGTYKIVTSVKIKFADGHTEWKTAVNCAKQVTFKGGHVTPPVTPPVTPGTPATPATPTTLVNTGPGSVVAIFAATSVLGTLAYRVFITRRLAGRL